MTTYKEIFGKPVKTLATDPSNAEAEGQIWYNSTSETFKSVVVGAAWSAASPVLVATQQPAAGGNYTANAGLKFSGIPSGPTTNRAEEWNGSGWSIGGSMNDSARYGNAGTGTQTAAVSMGGFIPGPNVRVADVENYDGSAWTVGTDMNTARHYLGATGPQTSIIAFGGSQPPYSAASEEWNGSAWTSGNPLNNARQGINGVGTQTAAYAFSGSNPGIPGAKNGTELYDGTSWTTGTSKNTPTAYYGCGGDGQSDAITFGGEGAPLRTATELWDGTAWTLSANMATAREARSGFGSTSNAVAGSGDLGPAGTLNTEEYNKSTSVITGAAWASGGNMSTGRVQFYGAGSQSSALAFGGETPGGDTTATEEYNGSTWSGGGNLPAANKDHAGAGTQTAGLSCGGVGGNTSSNNYDGTSWTASGTMNTSRLNFAGTGPQTSAFVFGGNTSPTGGPTSNTGEFYDGTSWTAAGGTLSATVRDNVGTGTQTAALNAGGLPNVSTAEEYNGSTWTTTGSLITGRQDARGAGTQTASLVMGGNFPNLTSVEIYDGTAFATQPSMTNTHTGGGSGQNASSASSAWISGGYSGPATSTEEFTGETSALNFKTLTTS